MNPDKLNAITQLIMALAAVVGPLSAAYIAHVRRQERKECKERGEELAREPPPTGMGPLLLLVLAGAAWAYLLSQHPELARLPLVQQDELAAAAQGAELQAKVGDPASVAFCAKDSDCGSGQSCERGKCVASAHKPGSKRPTSQRQQPRLVADISLQQLGDHQALPQLTTALAEPFPR